MGSITLYDEARGEKMKTKVNGSYQKFAESLREIVCDAVESTVKPEMEHLQTKIQENRQGIVNIAKEVNKISQRLAER